MTSEAKIRYLRLKHIIGDLKADPPIEPIIPIGRSTWWKWVKEGKAPKPVYLGPKTCAWPSKAVYQLAAEFSNQSEAA